MYHRHFKEILQFFCLKYEYTDKITSFSVTKLDAEDLKVKKIMSERYDILFDRNWN